MDPKKMAGDPRGVGSSWAAPYARHGLCCLLIILVTGVEACITPRAPVPAARFGQGLEFLRSRRWEPGVAYEHPVLREGVQVVAWWRKDIAPRPRILVIRAKNTFHPVRSAGDLQAFVQEIQSPADALNYSNLLREFLSPYWIADENVGQALSPRRHPSVPRGRGRSGWYSPSDAARWGVPFKPAVTFVDGGYQLERMVLLPPQSTPDGGQNLPWRVVFMEERVGPRGEFSFRVLRVLEAPADRYRLLLL